MKLLSIFTLYTFVCVTCDIFQEEECPEKLRNCNNTKKWPKTKKNYAGYIEPMSAWYYIMGNKWFLVTMTKVLTGKSPTSMDSIKDSCLAEQFTNNSGIMVLGYSETAYYHCKGPYYAWGEKECSPKNYTSNAKWAAERGVRDDTIVWTDYYNTSNYVLGVRCSGETVAWSLRSRENKNVDKRTKDDALEVLKGLGLETEDAVDIPRDGCPTISTDEFNKNFESA